MNIREVINEGPMSRFQIASLAMVPPVMWRLVRGWA